MENSAAGESPRDRIQINHDRHTEGVINPMRLFLIIRPASCLQTALKAPAQRRPLTTVRMAYKTSRRDVFIASKVRGDERVYSIPEGCKREESHPLCEAFSQMYTVVMLVKYVDGSSAFLAPLFSSSSQFRFKQAWPAWPYF